MVPILVSNPLALTSTNKNPVQSPTQRISLGPRQKTTEFQLPTPVIASRLEHYLTGYPQAKPLISGFQNGFSLGTTSNLSSFYASNHPSVIEHEEFVKNKIAMEVSKNRVKGPYVSPPLPNFITSPLGVVPKKSANSFRIIHDLSYPRNDSSVNAAIPRENSTVELENFDHVANLILQSGQGSLVAKADIEEAFRILPISPIDYHKLGFTFLGKFYFDTVLPMGASSSVALFESFSKSLQWILQNKLGVQKVSHIIDDFIFIGSPNSPECAQSLDKFMALASDIGVPIKNDKTVFPSTQVILHGIEVDTVSLRAKLPEDKLICLKTLLADTVVKKKVTLRQLQSLIGHLNFACKVIKPGRCFLRRLYDLIKGKTCGKHLIRLNNQCRKDLRIWFNFLTSYNGCTLLTRDRFISSKTIHLHSDAAGSKGFGCTHLSSWTFGEFPEFAKRHHINILELYPIALAVFMFGHTWCNKNILFICDNMAVVHCLNNQTSKDPVMMNLIRIIVLKALELNFCFKSKHISTTNNSVCDKLSRFQIEEALRLAPHLDQYPTPIPYQMSPAKVLQ